MIFLSIYHRLRLRDYLFIYLLKLPISGQCSFVFFAMQRSLARASPLSLDKFATRCLTDLSLTRSPLNLHFFSYLV